jgi:aryl-alcohol dehydrogenase-like predicted oxidoreductase
LSTQAFLRCEQDHSEKEHTVQYTQLGATGAFVSRICLGTMTFGGANTPPWDRMGGLGQPDVDRLVGTALERGVNFVDTADLYAGGESEQLLGRALGRRRDDVVLATKLYSRTGPGPNDAGLSRLHVLRALENSLRRLGTDHVDLYQIHSFDPLTPLEETLCALDDVVRQGKVRYIGCSNLAAWQLAKALGVSARHGLASFVSTQVYYSLVGRDVEQEVLPMVRSENVGMLVYSPLAAGFLTGKTGRDGAPAADGSRRAEGDSIRLDRERGFDIVDVLRVVAERHGGTTAQIALAWVLAQRGVTSVIVGARRPEQMADNLAAVDIELSEEDLAELAEVSAVAATYPGYIQEGGAAQRLPLAG